MNKDIIELRNTIENFGLDLTIFLNVRHGFHEWNEYSNLINSILGVVPESTTLEKFKNFPNVLFYSNLMGLNGTGEKIDYILEHWKGKYDLLESRHDYIQWLFPSPIKSAFNRLSSPLKIEESEIIKNDPKLLKRAIASYELILDFFGMKFIDPVKKDGKLQRTNNFEERYKNLNSSSHNYLRITRILIFLGMIGLEYYKLQFLEFVISEIYDYGYLVNARNSLKEHWIGTLRNPKEKERLLKKIKQKGR